MAVYLVTGKLGGGKTLVAVHRMVEYIERGSRVATNLNLDFAKLPKSCKNPRVVRLSDFPTGEHLSMLGVANESRDETKNGLLVLDECGVLFNSREWNDKGRQSVVDWLLHSRKLGWDVLLIVQHPALLDKQIRESVCEFLVSCRRMDRIQIPMFGWFIRLLTFGLFKGRFPRVHVASVRYGIGATSSHADTWTYRGDQLFGLYDTRQMFSRTDSAPYSYIDPRCTPEDTRRRRRKPQWPIARLLAALPKHEAEKWSARYWRSWDNYQTRMRAECARPLRAA